MILFFRKHAGLRAFIKYFIVAAVCGRGGWMKRQHFFKIIINLVLQK